MKRIVHIHQRYILTSVLLALCLNMVAQNRATFKARSQENHSRQIRTTLTTSDTIALEGMGTIYSLSIDATIFQPREASFTRIVLEDTKGHDYLVAESDWFRFDTTTVNLDRYCEETALLEGITPLRLKCYIACDAKLTLNGIHLSSQPATRQGGDAMESKEIIKEAQARDIADRINTYNLKHKKLWFAGITDRTLYSYESTKSLNIEEDSYSANHKYYLNGFYEIGERVQNQMREPSLYVDSLDWRIWHGKNFWQTIPKNQRNSSWCVPFASISVIESLTNFYYNRNLNLNLSEEDVAFNNYRQCYHCGTGIDNGLSAILNYGAIDEDSFPFDTIGSQPFPSQRPDYSELITIDSIGEYNPRYSGTEDLKGILLKYGPVVSGYFRYPNIGNSNHAMALIGYGKVTANEIYRFFNQNNIEEGPTITENDDRIGLEYWIFKDSYYQDPNPYFHTIYGEHDGYEYIVFNNLNKFHDVVYVKGFIHRMNHTDEEILCLDEDGDGYYNWGIGNKPPHCPAWAPDLSDGDDSDRAKGHMNEYGFYEELSLDRPIYQYISNDSTLTQPENRTSYLGILRGATVTLQSQQTFTNGTQLLLDKGSTLIINGVTISGSYIRPYAGCKIILNNGAKIQKPFEVPLGVELTINRGSVE